MLTSYPHHSAAALLRQLHGWRLYHAPAPAAVLKRGREEEAEAPGADNDGYWSPYGEPNSTGLTTRGCTLAFGQLGVLRRFLVPVARSCPPLEGMGGNFAAALPVRSRETTLSAPASPRGPARALFVGSHLPTPPPPARMPAPVPAPRPRTRARAPRRNPYEGDDENLSGFGNVVLPDNLRENFVGHQSAASAPYYHRSAAKPEYGEEYLLQRNQEYGLKEPDALESDRE